MGEGRNLGGGGTWKVTFKTGETDGQTDQGQLGHKGQTEGFVAPEVPRARAGWGKDGAEFSSNSLH